MFVNKPAIWKNNIAKGTAHVNTVIISINIIIACQNVNKVTRSPAHVLQDKKTLEMETVILFVKMVLRLKKIVPVPL